MAELSILFGLVLIFLVVARRLPDVDANLKTNVPLPPPRAVLPTAKPPVAVLPESAPHPTAPPKSRYAPAVEELLADGDRLFDQHKLTLAERRYLNAASIDPHCVHALNRLGIIYLDETAEYADAEEAFRAALHWDPENTYVAHNLGLALYKQAKFTDAAHFLEQAVEGGSKSSVRYTNLGVCYLALRQYSKAVSSLRRALALEKDNEQIKALLDEAKQKDKQHKSLARSVIG